MDSGNKILVLEKRAEGTILLLEYLDKLFDSLNGRLFTPPATKESTFGILD